MAYFNAINRLKFTTSNPSFPSLNRNAKSKSKCQNRAITILSRESRLDEALHILHTAEYQCIRLDFTAYSSLLNACIQLKALAQGKRVHAHMLIFSGFPQNVYLQVKLLTMYATCGSLDDARQVFDKMRKPNIFAWNAIIRGYAWNGSEKESLSLYHKMQEVGVKPNNFTYPFVLKACAGSLNLSEGREIHFDIIRNDLESDVYVAAALVDMYSKCGSVDDARNVFDKMSTRDVVSWNAMIAGYAHNGRATEALSVFSQMQDAGVKLSRASVVSVLPACADLAALQQGREIHDYVIRNGLEGYGNVSNALLGMYAKCGTIRTARNVFDRMYNRDVVSWNAMIAGYAMHGQGEAALALFSELQQITELKPDHITFVGVLSACSNAGLLDAGWRYFNLMSGDYCIPPRVEHYTCMVNLLGRTGHLTEAYDLIKTMPCEPDACVLGSLLFACHAHGNIELGELVLEWLLEFEPDNAGNYVILSNIYAAAGRWSDVAKVRTMLKDKGMKKSTGCSWIEIRNKIHAFVAADRSHPQSDKIYAVLGSLEKQMNIQGYVADTSFVLHDIDEEEKKNVICSHSEKLAVAFGLINTSPGTPIQVTKNLRVCGDCHTAIKFISRIASREIILRDVNRFHHFRHGVCSCGDYW